MRSGLRYLGMRTRYENKRICNKVKEPNMRKAYASEDINPILKEQFGLGTAGILLFKFGFVI